MEREGQKAGQSAHPARRRSAAGAVPMRHRALPQHQPFPQFPPWQSRAVNRHLHLITTGRHEVAAKNGDCKTHQRPNRERVVTMLRFGYTTAAAPARREAARQRIAPRPGRKQELARGETRGKDRARLRAASAPGPSGAARWVDSALSASQLSPIGQEAVFACVPPPRHFPTWREKRFTAAYLLSASRCC